MPKTYTFMVKKGSKKMGLLDRISDAAVKKITKKETVRVSCKALAEIVRDEFIKGADDDFLKKVQKTAKGGGFFTRRNLNSNDGRYRLFVGGIQRMGFGKQTYVVDNVANKFYELEKDRYWKKFYKTVADDIKMEKINRDR